MAKKKKKKIPLKKLIRRLERKADTALSLYVRAVSKWAYTLCPFCSKNPIQCCFHFISRRRKILRWRLENVTGACHSCNYMERNWPDISRAWFIRTFGLDLYLKLVDESREPFLPTLEYLEGIVAKYKKELEQIENQAVIPNASQS